MKQFYVTLFLFISFASFSQELLKDINKSNASSHPRLMMEINGKQYFIAKGVENGAPELWVTDGTAPGTNLVKASDSNGPYIYPYSSLVSLGNKVLFNATGYSPVYSGTEPWISDGTDSGTKLLKDINPGAGQSFAANFRPLGNNFIFTADNGVNGYELWITDGTTDGTVLLKDIDVGSTSSTLTNFTLTNDNRYYFTAYNSTSGGELWVTDGTISGTYMVKDINSGSSSSNPANLTVIGTKLFFSATNNASTGLWITDGTDAGTTLFSSAQYASPNGPDNFRKFNDKLIFTARDGLGDAEIWVSDGTPQGTHFIKNISASGSSYPEDLTIVGDYIFFTALNGVNGRELWKTDGTPEETVMVKDINLASSGDVNLSFYEYPYNLGRKFFNVNNKLYFLANSGSEGFELWRSDGTESGTSLVRDFVTGNTNSFYSNWIVSGNFLFFAVDDDSGEIKYYKIDSFNSPPQVFNKTSANLPFENVYPMFVTTESKFYFTAFNELTGYELYVTDGINTTYLKDINTSSLPSHENFNLKAGLNDQVIFSYDDNKHGLELWTTDGQENTKLFKELSTYPNWMLAGGSIYSNSSVISNIEAFKGYVYVVSNGQIWRSDGQTLEQWQSYGSSNPVYGFSVFSDKIMWFTQNKLYKYNGISIELITTIPNWNNSYNVSSRITEMNGEYYFWFSTNNYGKEIWKTNGTSLGTNIVKDITPGSGSTSEYHFVKVGTKLFFVNYDANGSELWVTDGTSPGTFMVKDIYPGSNSSSPDFLTNYGDNLLVFKASDGVHGNEAWKSDGTSSGTVRIPNSFYNNSYSYAQYFTNLNSKIYYFGQSINGPSLFSTDGNSTTIVKTGINISSIFNFNNQLYMSAALNNSYPFDFELWRSDGTENGTVLLKDINAGVNYSDPSHFFDYNGFLYFMADDGTHGQEIWVLSPPCIDSLNISTSLNKVKDYKTEKAIVGQTANTITSTAKITYDAGKYVLLKPGFSTNQGAVFLSKIGGCISQISASSAATNKVSVKPDQKTRLYFQDMIEHPGIEDFIKYGNNNNLRDVWMKFQESIRTLIYKKYMVGLELNMIEKKKNEASDNPLILNNYYIKKRQNEQLYENVRQELSQYNYFINPARNGHGKKIGYDLVIYYEGKMHQSIIRY